MDNDPVLPNEKINDVQTAEGTMQEKEPVEEIVKQQTAGPGMISMEIWHERRN